MPEPGTNAVPDVAWLTQLANDLFRMQLDSPPPAVPTFASRIPPYPAGGAGPATSSTPLPAAPVAGAPVAGASIPAEDGTRALLGEPPGWLAPPNAVGGFGPAVPSAPPPPTSVNEVPLPATPMAGAPAPDTSVPAAGEVRTPFDEPPGALVPPNAVGGFGLTAPSTPLDATSLPEIAALDGSVPRENELRALLGTPAAVPFQRHAAGGLGSTAPFGATSLPDIAALDASIPWESELRALLGAPLAPQVPATTQSPGSPGAPAPSFYFLEEAGQGVPAGASQPTATPGPAYDANWRRADFPILSERVNGRPLIWLDNGATTQKPRVVIDRLSYFYEHENSNVHRAAHELAARATDAYEGARETVRRFLHAGSADEIVFVRGTTEAINLVAQSWGRRFVGPGDEILITWLEHHANIVPWQMLCEQTGAKLKVAPVDDDGQVLIEEYGSLLGPRTKLVAFTQVSNALGTITPSALMTAMAHAVGARVLVDGAQSVAHMRTDVQAIGCDWFVFSGHKIFAPTGIGGLFGRTDVLAESPPWQGGGSMIRDVTFEQTAYQTPPARFEAGTGNIADAVGLGTALDYVELVGLEAIAAHEHDLLLHATHLLSQIPGLRMLGTAPEKAGVLSFVIDGLDTEAIGKALNRDGIAVRAGHHCAQPILRRFGVEASVRATLALYNTHADIDALATALRRIRSSTAGFP
jgi:cysteine desulfurase/selenocysteine lyase